MTFQRQVLFWIGALILLVLSMWVLREVLLPFVAGIVLAYFLILWRIALSVSA